jgi:hypothetical protein
MVHLPSLHMYVKLAAAFCSGDIDPNISKRPEEVHLISFGVHTHDLHRSVILNRMHSFS